MNYVTLHRMPKSELSCRCSAERRAIVGNQGQHSQKSQRTCTHLASDRASLDRGLQPEDRAYENPGLKRPGRAQAPPRMPLAFASLAVERQTSYDIAVPATRPLGEARPDIAEI